MSDLIRTQYPVMFGIEIEASDFSDDIHPIPPYWRIRTGIDMSIRGINPLEFKIGPCHPNRLKRLVHHLYEAVRPSANDSCGIHIHVDRRFISNFHDPVDFSKRWTGHIVEMSARDHFELFGRYPKVHCSSIFHDDHYAPVSSNPPGTIEFRIFASSNKSAWACQCIDMVYSMITCRRFTMYKALRRYEKLFGCGWMSHTP